MPPPSNDVELDVDAVDAPERLELVANEHAELRSLARGVHVGDDQDAHFQVANAIAVRFAVTVLDRDRFDEDFPSSSQSWSRSGLEPLRA